MSSREAILSSLRNAVVPSVDAPPADFAHQSFEDPLAHFIEVLESVGGKAIQLPSGASSSELLSHLPVDPATSKVVSLFPDLLPGNVDLAAINDPHDLHDIGLALLGGQLGVAENGAIWLDLTSVKHRVICVLAEHVAILLPASQIVSTMHEAYRQVSELESAAGLLQTPRFGLFLSGPSKTADIEQSLVIGAHGARSLTVFLAAD